MLPTVVGGAEKVQESYMVGMNEKEMMIVRWIFSTDQILLGSKFLFFESGMFLSTIWRSHSNSPNDLHCRIIITQLYH